MYQTKRAEISDVDLLLDIKLDIIFNSKEAINFDRNEMEKIVNYSEEEIRENIEDYKIIYEEKNIVAVYAVVNYNNGKLIDTIYVKPDYRKEGIAKKILNNIINTNYEELYLWVYKSNEIAIKLYEKLGFKIEEETETRLFMKNTNIKENNNIIKARLFCKDVEKLYEKYNLEYFFVTEGASSTKVKNNIAVRNARNKHIDWEKENGENPNEDWKSEFYI